MKNERKEELKDEMKNRISMALKDPIHAPWEIYIPALIVEVILDCIFIPKIMDNVDEWRKRK